MLPIILLQERLATCPCVRLLGDGIWSFLIGVPLIRVAHETMLLPCPKLYLSAQTP